MYGLMFADKMCLYLYRSLFICSLVTCLCFSCAFLSENENVVQCRRGWNEKLFHCFPNVLSKLLLLGVSGLLKSSFRAWFSQASRNSVSKLSTSFLLVHLSKMFLRPSPIFWRCHHRNHRCCFLSLTGGFREQSSSHAQYYRCIMLYHIYYHFDPLFCFAFISLLLIVMRLASPFIFMPAMSLVIGKSLRIF